MVIVEFSVPDSLVALKKFSFSNNNNDSVAGPSVYVSKAATAEDACSDPDHADYTSKLACITHTIHTYNMRS